MILGTQENWFYYFWIPTQFYIDFTSLLYKLNYKLPYNSKRPATPLSAQLPGPAQASVTRPAHRRTERQAHRQPGRPR